MTELTLQGFFAISINEWGWIGFGLTGLFGLILGSALATLAYRLPLISRRQAILETNALFGTEISVPKHIGLFYPRSFCPDCEKPIKAYFNIPILGYLLQRGECGRCNAKISLRYPVLELLTVVVVLANAWIFDLVGIVLLNLIPLLVLVVLFWTDFENRTLPDRLTIPLAIAGLVVTGLFPDYRPSVSFLDASIGLIAGYLTFSIINGVYRLIRKTDGIGQGDMKLLAALGAWFGWMLLPVLILVSTLLSLIFAILTKSQQGLALDRQIPTGSFLACTGILLTLTHSSILSSIAL